MHSVIDPPVEKVPKKVKHFRYTRRHQMGLRCVDLLINLKKSRICLAILENSKCSFVLYEMVII